MSFKASQDLGLIKVILSVEKTDKIVAQYQQLFKTFGCLKTSYHIKTDPEIRPTICPPRNQPVALMDRIKEELDEMEALQVIRKIDEPTERVNSMVVVEKPKTHKLRICLDPRALN